MEVEKQQKLMIALLIFVGVIVFVGAGLFLDPSSTRDIVRGMGVGICLIGAIVEVVLWRQSS